MTQVQSSIDRLIGSKKQTTISSESVKLMKSDWNVSKMLWLKMNEIREKVNRQKKHTHKLKKIQLRTKIHSTYRWCVFHWIVNLWLNFYDVTTTRARLWVRTLTKKNKDNKNEFSNIVSFCCRISNFMCNYAIK